MPSTTPEAIAELLARSIRGGEFPAGAPLVQEDLARRFGVSRNPVREALRVLAAEGLVTIRPGEGASVRVLTAEELEELYDLRILLEPSIAQHIVHGATRRNLLELRSIAESMDGAVDDGAWMRANFTFHSSLYALADRPHTEATLRMLLAAVQPYSASNIGLPGGRAQATAEHHEMIDAISAGDDARLATVMRTHLESARARLRALHVPGEATIPRAYSNT